MVNFLSPEIEEVPYRLSLRAGASLQAALMRPQTLHQYGGVEDLPSLAAGLMWAITRTHALIDGNKRASVCLADRLLAVNGHHLAGDEDALYDMTAAAAESNLSEEALAERMRNLVAPGPPRGPFAERYPRVMARLAA